MFTYRTAVSVAFVLALTSTFVSRGIASDDPDKPPVEEFDEATIEQAVKNLGSRVFNVRERASALLWRAGKRAELALIKAAKSDDPEVRQRADAILDKFLWGIYPDTSPKIVELIQKFRGSDTPTRQQVASELLGLGDPGYAVLTRLLNRIDDEKRSEFFGGLMIELRQRVPDLLVRGQDDTVRQLLRLNATAASLEAAADYAAFEYLTGQLDPAIARCQAELETADEKTDYGISPKNLHFVLAHLYRIKEDWKAARRSAEKSGYPLLVEQVLWEAGDWKGLSEYIKDGPPLGLGNELGTRLAYHRLAGDEQAIKETLTDIRNQIDLSTEDEYELRQLTEGLLLNGRHAEAIATLKYHKRSLPFVYDLLATQRRYKDANELVDSVRGDGLIPDATRSELTLRRARVLYSLGEGEASKQLFRQLIDDVNRDNNWSLASDLIKHEVRVGATDLALAHAAECLEILHQRDGSGEPRQVLDELFSKRADAAGTWWTEFRGLEPKLTPNARLELVRELLAGKIEVDRINAWARKLDLDGEATWPRHRALAEAYWAVPDYPQAEKYFRQAAELSGGVAQFLRLGDIMAQRGKFNQAAEAYHKAWETSPTNAYSLMLWGLALKRAGKVDEGERVVTAAHRLPLGQSGTRASLAEKLAKRGLSEQARREIEVGTKVCWYRDYTKGNILNRAAQYANAEGDPERAANLYEQAAIGCMRAGATFIEPSAYLVVPQSVFANRARARVKQGKIDEAFALVEEGLEALPGDIDLAIEVVPELDRVGKKDAADKLFNRVWKTYEDITTRYPDSAWAHNSAGWLAANCQRELDAALKLSERAVKLRPESDGYLDTLAEIHFRRGDQEKAIELMKQCIEMDSDNQYYQKQLKRFRKGDINSPVPIED